MCSTSIQHSTLLLLDALIHIFILSRALARMDIDIESNVRVHAVFMV